MVTEAFRLDYHTALAALSKRIAEPAPGRIQLLAGPRQVGKTTLLLELAGKVGSPRAIYAAADAPEAALPGFHERLWARAEQVARSHGLAVVLLDEVHLLHDWAARLKGEWDRFRRLRIPVHVVASGSSALHLAGGSRESLAGRFEKVVLSHWSPRSLARAFGIDPTEAADLAVRQGTYPGAFPLRHDRERWLAYVREAILGPAIGRDLLALAPIRRPAMLRQVFAVAASSPARIVSLQKMQGQLQDPGALETIASYLGLLEEAYLVAALPKHSTQALRRRAAPPKLVTLDNALLAAVDPAGVVEAGKEPARFGSWVENACLAHAWNRGQSVCYWREEPLEVDAVTEGSWGHWAIEVKTGGIRPAELAALLEFVRRYPRYQPLLVCDEVARITAARAGVVAIDWRDFLVSGPPGAPEPG